MKNKIKDYLDTRDEIQDYDAFHRPVITFSREFGCEATPIANILMNKLQDRDKSPRNQDWKIINKEILEDVSHEMNVSPFKIEHIMEKMHKGMLNSVFSSMAYTGLSEAKIVSAIRDDIFNYAMKGNKIIIGRGGAYVTKKISNILHIRLTASVDWRIAQIMDKNQLNKEDAALLIHSMDIKRRAWLEHIAGPNPEGHIYDITFNRMKFDEETIANQILLVLEAKDMIKSLS